MNRRFQLHRYILLLCAALLVMTIGFVNANDEGLEEVKDDVSSIREAVQERMEERMEKLSEMVEASDSEEAIEVEVEPVVVAEPEPEVEPELEVVVAESEPEVVAESEPEVVVAEPEPEVEVEPVVVEEVVDEVPPAAFFTKVEESAEDEYSLESKNIFEKAKSSFVNLKENVVEKVKTDKNLQKIAAAGVGVNLELTAVRGAVLIVALGKDAIARAILVVRFPNNHKTAVF